jgi:hypothetical protein
VVTRKSGRPFVVPGRERPRWTVSLSAVVAAPELARLEETGGPKGWHVRALRGRLAREHPRGRLCGFTALSVSGRRPFAGLVRAVRSMRAHRARTCLVTGSWCVRATSWTGTLLLDGAELRWLAALGARLDVDLLDNRGNGSRPLLTARRGNHLAAAFTDVILDGSTLRSLDRRLRESSRGRGSPREISIVCAGSSSGQDGVTVLPDFRVAARGAHRLWIEGEPGEARGAIRFILHRSRALGGITGGTPQPMVVVTG